MWPCVVEGITGNRPTELFTYEDVLLVAAFYSWGFDFFTTLSYLVGNRVCLGFEPMVGENKQSADGFSRSQTVRCWLKKNCNVINPARLEKAFLPISEYRLTPWPFSTSRFLCLQTASRQKCYPWVIMNIFTGDISSCHGRKKLRCY